MLDSAKNRYRDKIRAKHLSDISKWENSFMFVTEEMQFLDKILSTDIFESNIPNLYERLQQFLKNLQDIKKEEKDLKIEVEKHKAKLSDQLELNEAQKFSAIKESHAQLKKKNKVFRKKYLDLKLEIFNFTGNILKKSS